MGKKYIGLDVHQASTTMVVIDSRGKMIQSIVTRTDAKDLRSLIASISGAKELALEEGCMSSWLYTFLLPVVDRLIVCDPTENKKIIKGQKNDFSDALNLADLLRGGYLKAVFHNTHPVDALRARLKTYQQITQDLVRCKNRVKALFRSRGVKTDASVYTPEGRACFVADLDRAIDKNSSHYLFENLDFLTMQQKRAGQAMGALARKQKAYKTLTTISGIGPIHAATLLAVVVNPERFRTKEQFWSYCGLAVVKRTSSDWVDGKKGLERRDREKTMGLNRNRNPHMKSVFKQASISAARSPVWKKYSERYLKNGSNPDMARITVARKIAAITLILWKKGEAFNPKYIS
jgi:transposase